jgi:putative sterol carrier protein
MVDVVPYLEKIRGKFDDPTTQDKLKGFTKTIQFVFTDLGKTYVMSIQDGKTATVEEKKLEKPDIQVTWASDTFTGIQDKTVNATTAFMSGKLKVKGSMDDMMKLQKIMM